MKQPRPNHTNPTAEQIAVRAYAVWEAAGRPQGRAVEHWLAAEAQLRAEAEPNPRGSRYGLVLKS